MKRVGHRTDAAGNETGESTGTNQIRRSRLAHRPDNDRERRNGDDRNREKALKPLISEHVEEFPGTRPARWWESSAPRSPRGTYVGCGYDGKLPEPRKRLGGIGSAQHDVLNVTPSFAFGIPTCWVDQWQFDYYTGIAVDVNGKLVNPNPSGTFNGVAINPDDPPQFESQPVYLDRHGLFLPGERKQLTRAVCTENLIRVDDVMESPKLAE